MWASAVVYIESGTAGQELKAFVFALLDLHQRRAATGADDGMQIDRMGGMAGSRMLPWNSATVMAVRLPATGLAMRQANFDLLAFLDAARVDL